MGVRFEAWTLPETGTFTRRFHIKDFVSSSWREAINTPGTGNLTIGEDNPRATTVLSVDPDDRTNDLASMIRAYDGTDHLFDWYVKAVTPNVDSKTVDIAGEGVGSCLDRLIVLARDYNVQPTADPDWSYGLATVLNNPSFEDGNATNEVQVLFNDATGGTFKLSFDGGTLYTAAIAYNASASTVATEIEALAAVTDVLVSGSGTEAEPWFLEFADPQSIPEGVVDDALLTGHTVGSTISTLTGGGTLDPGYWVQSQNIDGNLYGEYAIFEVSSEQAHTGTYSLKIDGSDPTGQYSLVGAQQAVNVIPGRTYYGSAWVYPVGASLEARYVIRESATNNYITSSTFPFTTCPADQWTELVIAPFVMPAGVTQIYARVASVNKNNPPVFHVDDVVFAEGEPAAPLGQIFNDLLDDIDSHFAGSTSWLNRTFTDSLDSNAAAWDQNLSWRIKRGQTLRQLLDYAKRWNYEWEIRWNAGTEVFDFHLYNPLGLGDDLTTSGPAITDGIGAVSVDGETSRANEFNIVVAEGSEGVWGESEDTPLQTIWGQRFTYQGSKTPTDVTALNSLAARIITAEKSRSEGFRLRVSEPNILFGKDVRPGDQVVVNLPPKTKRDRRLFGYAAAVASTGVVTVTAEIDTRTYDPMTLVRNIGSGSANPKDWMKETRTGNSVGRGMSALEPVTDATDFLLRAFAGLDDLGESAGAPWPTSGNHWPIIVAAVDADADVYGIADYKCLGTTDGTTINSALTQAGEQFRPVVLSSGTFTLGGVELEVPVNVTMTGQGRDVSVLLWDGSSITSLAEPSFLPGPVINGLGNNRFADFTLDMGSGTAGNSSAGIFTHSTGAVADELAGFNTVDRVSVINGGDGVDDCGFYLSGPTAMEGCLAEGFQGGNGTGYYFDGLGTPEQVDSSSLINCDTYLINGYGVRMRTAPNLVVDGCTLAMFGGRSVYVDTGCDGAVITNSRCEYDQWIASTVTFAGNNGMQTMDIRATADFSQIIDNTWSTDSEIVLTAAEQILIHGNKFQTAGNAAHVVIHGSGDQIQIIDNIFYDLDEEAIETVGGTDWRITDNLFDPAGNDAAYIITVDATSTGIRIVHNDAVSGVTGFVNDLGTGTIFHSNIVDGADAGVPASTVSPLTTKGDLWGYDTVDDRIPVGADGTVLTADSVDGLGVSWQEPAFNAAYFIAANNASQREKDVADETLDGTDDHTQINTALTNHNHVILSTGTFDIGAPIEMPSATWLQGSGMAATVLQANGITTGDRAVIVSKSNTAIFLQITDLAIDGNYATGGPCHGIRLRNTGQDVVDPPAPGADNWSIIQNVFIEGTRDATTTYKGIWLESATSDQRSNIINNYQGREFGGAGLHLDGSSDNIVSNVHIGSSRDYGFWVAGANNRFTNCKSFFADDHAFYITSARNTFAGCEAQDMAGDGFHITGNNTTVVGAHIGSEASGRNCLSGVHLAASQCTIQGINVRIGSGTMDNGVNFSSGSVNMVHGVIANANADFDTAQNSGTPNANDDIRLVRNGTTVYTG